MRREAVGPWMARSGSLGRGFALVEVLAALAVAALGTLGAAAGYTASLRAVHAAASAHRVLDVAADAGERLRAVAPAARPAALAAWTVEARTRLGRLPGAQPAAEHRASAQSVGAHSFTSLRLHWVDRVDVREREWLAFTGVATR